MLRSLRFVFQQVQTKGFWPTFHRLRMTNFLGVQPGTLKGVDKYGNEYYESAEEAEINGQERWIMYANPGKYDASQIPPEWHMWIHRMRDEPPTERPPVEPMWKNEHKPTAASQYGVGANYLPKGHFLKQNRRVQKYEAWHKDGKPASE